MYARKERGFVLVTTSLAAVFLLGMAGLAIDIGRMYVARSETQSFVDSASLDATAQLDDTAPGIGALRLRRPQSIGPRVNLILAAGG